MKIAWLTPLTQASAIGGVTVRIAERLILSADVELWTSDRSELHPTTVPIVRYTVSDPFEQALRGYDAVLYNLGDQYSFHRDVHRMSCRVPGIAVLHDFVMHHFFADFHIDQSGRLDAYHAAIERLYGPAARADVEADTDPPFYGTDRVVDYPFFEDALHNATGVIVHAEFLAAKVRAVTEAPVRRLYLPAVQVPAVSAVPDVPNADAPPLQASHAPEDRALLLTIGHVNPNKRVLEIIETLGRNPDLAARVTYVVAGALPDGNYPGELRATVARFGLDDVVRFVGHQSVGDLHRWLEQADICLNLRHPVMEGASASLADQLTFGKAVVVSDTGAFGEVPDDCVRKIAPGREVEQLPAILREWLDDPQARRAYADRGREYAHTHFEPDRYVSGLLEFIQEAGAFAAMVSYADRLGAVMRHLGVTAGMPLVETVARESANLFGSPVTSPWRPGTREDDR